MVAIAQTLTTSAVRNFRTIDTDRDSKLDRRELTAAAARDFDRLDVDHVGFLTRRELTKTTK
jgi:Ca2+-binding EF-hand superfamily protein